MPIAPAFAGLRVDGVTPGLALLDGAAVPYTPDDCRHDAPLAPFDAARFAATLRRLATDRPFLEQLATHPAVAAYAGHSGAGYCRALLCYTTPPLPDDVRAALLARAGTFPVWARLSCFTYFRDRLHEPDAARDLARLLAAPGVLDDPRFRPFALTGLTPAALDAGVLAHFAGFPRELQAHVAKVARRQSPGTVPGVLAWLRALRTAGVAVIPAASFRAWCLHPDPTVRTEAITVAHLVVAPRGRRHGGSSPRR